MNCVSIGSVDELEALLAELEKDALAALEYDRLAEERRQKVRANLPKARAAGAGPARLERTIHGLFVVRSISRWTAGSATETKAKGGRKRPGGAPAS